MSDQARLTQLSRLKAKQAIRASALAARRRSASPPNASAGPPVPKTSRDAAAASKELAPLERDSRLGNYFEYDLSKMVNSRGGFLLDDDEGLGERAAIEKKRKEEREKAFNGKSGAWEPGLDAHSGPRCRECRTVEIDQRWLDIFHIGICGPCKKKFPDKYSLLTKTECRSDYLLTDDELKDETILPHLLRPNPHGGTFSNMMLFLRLQAEEFAFKKWGGEEALDDEFDRREKEKSQKKAKKFQKGLQDLRARTKHNPYQKRLDAEHVHAFDPPEVLDNGKSVKACAECGFQIEIELL